MATTTTIHRPSSSPQTIIITDVATPAVSVMQSQPMQLDRLLNLLSLLLSLLSLLQQRSSL